ncbi:MAG: HEPN domain-containing protein [Acidobacteria bacterium]|nr:HEPN domain-containing protein [Acidobacteriota bacterium]
MNLTPDELLVLVGHKMQRASEALRDARFLLENKRNALAVNRVYYGMFYALSAFALKKGFASSKHQPLISWFNQGFVKTGRVDGRFGKALHRAYDKRSFADYADYVVFSEAEVQAMIQDLDEFITEMGRLISQEAANH